MLGRDEKGMKNLVGKHETKKCLGRARHRSKDSIRTDAREIV
jgi:hypothetical protein